MNPAIQPRPPSTPASGAAVAEVKIKRITFVSKGLALMGVNSNVDSLQARGPDVESGVDIVWLPDERHYRISRYTNGQLATTYEVHESLVEFRERA